MENLVVSKETVVNDWGLPYDDCPDHGIEILEDSVIDDSDRWSIQHELVVSINGVNYITFYDRGATEEQLERPWDYVDFVTFYPAEQKMVPKWVRSE